MMTNKWKSLQSVDMNFLSKIVMIASHKGFSTNCSLMLNYKGEVFSVGSSDVGCLGIGLPESTQPVKLVELSGVAGVSVCGGYGDALAYTKEGKVFVWGKNARCGGKHTRLGCGTRPVLLPQLDGVVEASCVRGHYLAVTRNGKVYEWRGVQSYISNKLNTTPTVVQISDEIVNIACGPYHSLALTKNGDVYIWGKNFSGNTCLDQPLCKVPFPEETVAKVACGWYYSVVLTHSCKVFTWGHNSFGFGDVRGRAVSITPVQVGENIGRFKDIAVNGWETCAAVTEDGTIYMWSARESDTELRTPTVTQFAELQQVFASMWPSRYTWRCDSSAVEPPSYDSVDIESNTIREKLKNTFNDKDSSDLTLMIDNKPIYVHRFVLNLRSNYFQAMLQSHWTDKNESEIVLSSYSYEVYKSYLWFLYSGEVVSTVENLLELWSLANAFSEDEFKTGCEKLMYKKNLTLETLALLHSVAMTKKDVIKAQDGRSLKEKITKFETNIEKIQQKQENLQVDKNKLLKELEGLEEEIQKQQKECNETDEALLVKLQALRKQSKELKLMYEDSPDNIQESLTKVKTDCGILKGNYTKLEYEKEKLNVDKAEIYKDSVKRKKNSTKTGKENEEIKEDCIQIEKENSHVEHKNALKNIDAFKEYYKKIMEENDKINEYFTKIEKENETYKESHLKLEREIEKLKENYKKQQEILEKLRSVII